MHTIEPFYLWKDYYESSEDKNSPFYGNSYDEFFFTHTIYNYYIHPQWDAFGSNTLYAKVLFCDYDTKISIIELIGEWNDCLYNDIMYLIENMITPMISSGLDKFVLICENVLNFHGSDNSYYEEWYEEVSDIGGWIVFLNTLEHVEREMRDTHIHHYVNMINDLDWRRVPPANMLQVVEMLLNSQIKEL
jgi:uncharacterized membrane protein YagU involved in acid resistance